MRYFDELDIRKIGERRWKLLSDFRFESNKYPGIFVAPKGMETNFASIPRILYRLYPPVGNYDEAAVIHDGAHNGLLLTPKGERINCIKRVGDDLFLEALGCETMRHSRVGDKTANLMYFFVKNFGKK